MHARSSCAGRADYATKKQRVLGWEDIPVGERPRMLSVFPAGWDYLRQWNTLRWFLLLLPPVVASSCAVVARGQGWPPAIFVLAGGHFVAAALFVTVASGMSSSNWGTYFRSREPVQYWLDVAILAIGYLVMCACGYILHAANPAANSP